MAEIPLFPLPVVLFPGGKLPIEILEPRYLDMIGRCMRENVGFGVVLIEEGEQTLASPDDQLPTVSWCGTYATITDFDQSEKGALTVVAEGQVKFVVRDFFETADRLMMAQVEFIELEEEAEIPEDQQHLVNLLEMFLEHEAVQSLRLEVNYEQAREVGARLTELLPCPNHFKQRMLEMKNPLARLNELEKLIDRMQDAKS